MKLRQFISGSLGILGFVLSILAGLYANNAFESILLKALLAAAACYFVGFIVGYIAEHVAHEQAQRLANAVAQADAAAAEKAAAEAAEKAADAQPAEILATEPAPPSAPQQAA